VAALTGEEQGDIADASHRSYEKRASVRTLLRFARTEPKKLVG
jgi:hypothetical protein